MSLQNIKSTGFKIKGLNEGAKNLVLKPSSINQNQSFTSNNSMIKPAIKMMTEQEFNQKKEEIISSYSVKLVEIEDLIQHYNERIKSWKTSDAQFEKGHPIYFDQKIKAKLEAEEKEKKRQMEEDINRLKRGNEKPKQLVVKRLIGGDQARGNSSLSIKDIGINLKNENPYANNKQHDSGIESEETVSKSMNSARGPGLRQQDDLKEQVASLKQKIADQEAKYNKEIEELKKQSQLKKAEFKENIQYTKKQMDQLKKQIEPLKQIII